VSAPKFLLGGCLTIIDGSSERVLPRTTFWTRSPVALIALCTPIVCYPAVKFIPHKSKVAICAHHRSANLSLFSEPAPPRTIQSEGKKKINPRCERVIELNKEFTLLDHQGLDTNLIKLKQIGRNSLIGEPTQPTTPNRKDAYTQSLFSEINSIKTALFSSTTSNNDSLGCFPKRPGVAYKAPMDPTGSINFPRPLPILRVGVDSCPADSKSIT
jgi:hypothetical protein